jgi:hypothetical protein
MADENEADIPEKITTPETTENHVDYSEDDSINFRGRLAYPSKWLSDVSSCQYLPENNMITLCQILVFFSMYING